MWYQDDASRASSSPPETSGGEEEALLCAYHPLITIYVFQDIYKNSIIVNKIYMFLKYILKKRGVYKKYIYI
jgi:hypothetical protein